MQLILITGLSGSGKSVALAVLEDAGHYCVDNLPLDMVAGVVESLHKSGIPRAALTVDARAGAGVARLPELVQELRAAGHDLRVMFLEAKSETLIKRYSETRRRHPLSDGVMTLPECIARERELVATAADIAHHIDTSDLAPNTLRAWVKDFAQIPAGGLTLLFESFGFKHGIPLDADFVFDVRCLPNPYYDPKLRPLTGLDGPVAVFIEANPDAMTMFADIQRFVGDWLPAFERDNRSYLTVAIGCTGGQHRSVYFADRLARGFGTRHRTLARHRELGT
ncbi:MAG: RNase adapter RapZ [Betaproteobacteria bacterium]|nr:RNase adapter RapZ [Betaproteobacteria bacterium]